MDTEPAAEETEIAYYDLDGVILAAVGSFGFDGFFKLNRKEQRWEHLDLNSPRGDSLHQEVFLAHRADRLDGPPEGAPALPLDEPFASMPREHYYASPPILLRTFPT